MNPRTYKEIFAEFHLPTHISPNKINDALSSLFLVQSFEREINGEKNTLFMLNEKDEKKFKVKVGRYIPPKNKKERIG